MPIDHTDPEAQKLFDTELIAARAGYDHIGLPECIRSQADRDITIGILDAMARNPTEQQKLVRDLAAQFVVDPATGKLVAPELPIDTDPRLIERAGLIARLAHRARATDLVPVP